MLHVNTSATNPLLSAQNSTRQMFFLMALATIISTAALLLTVRAVRSSAALASMKSDFVAAVTHELKTQSPQSAWSAIPSVGGRRYRKRAGKRGHEDELLHGRDLLDGKGCRCGSHARKLRAPCQPDIAAGETADIVLSMGCNNV